MKAILTINSGSSTIKFAIFSLEQNKLQRKYNGIVDRVTTNPTFKVKAVGADKEFSQNISVSDPKETYYEQAVEYILQWAINEGFAIQAVGHRIVHGGPDYFAPIVLDNVTLKKLASYNAIMPLHQPFNLQGVQILKQKLPHALQVGCFDTGFHVTCDPISQTYALPQKFRDAGVRRYGFHGLSYEYIASQLPLLMPEKEAQKKFIVAHLGNGATMCALNNQKSFATSIGFTAIGGLPMGTRCDSIDPGAVLYLMNVYGLTVDAMLNIFYRESGLLGLSGISADMRELLASKDPNAKLAIDVFVQRISLFAGALAAELQGCNGLIFTGGIGENATLIRQMVCDRLKWLGINIDKEKNAERNLTARKISTEESKASIWIIPTDEEIIIAKHTLALLTK